MTSVQIRIQGTPNPNAWKFILDQAVLNEGKASFNEVSETLGNTLAKDLIEIVGVKQVHFFQNVVTITGRMDCDPDEVQKQVIAVLETRMPVHNPNWAPQDAKAERRKTLSPELQKLKRF